MFGLCLAGESVAAVGLADVFIRQSNRSVAVWCVSKRTIRRMLKRSYSLPSITQHEAAGLLTPADSYSLIFLFSLGEGEGGSRPLGAGHS